MSRKRLWLLASYPHLQSRPADLAPEPRIASYTIASTAPVLAPASTILFDRSVEGISERLPEKLDR